MWTIYRGEKKLKADTESKERKLVNRWIQWYSTTAPPHARFTFHISQEFQEGKEKIRLFPCEVSESGVSLNRLNIQCRYMANSCLDTSENTEFALAFGSSPKLLQFPGETRARENYLRYEGVPLQEGDTDWDKIVRWATEEDLQTKGEEILPRSEDFDKLKVYNIYSILIPGDGRVIQGQEVGLVEIQV